MTFEIQLDPLLTLAEKWYAPEFDGTRSFRWTSESSRVDIKTTLRINDEIVFSISSPEDKKVDFQIFGNDFRISYVKNVSAGTNVCRIPINKEQPSYVEICCIDKVKGDDRFLGVMVLSIKIERPFNHRFYLSRQDELLGEIPKRNKPIISAYYYLWYYTQSGVRAVTPMKEGKWSEGYARAMLNPPQYPMLGEYVSNDPKVIETHIDWAADHGIDCFICAWEGMNGHRKFLSENLVHILQGSHLDGTWSAGKINYSKNDSTGNNWDSISQGWAGNGYQIKNLERMNFSLLIESRCITEEWPPIVASEHWGKLWSDIIVYLAENFFCSPRWMRVDGKPVIYTYEVFSWVGDCNDFIQFREIINSAACRIYDPLTGRNFSGVFLIGDALYPVDQDMNRLKIFDAICGYQPYPPVDSAAAANPQDSWIYRGVELFLSPKFVDYHNRFQAWGQENQIPIIPTVLPKYNDRGVRGVLDHYALPPCSYSPFLDIEESRTGGLFIRNLEAQLKYVDPGLNMISINSWNEWFEDTSIEPIGYIETSLIPDFYQQSANIGTSTSVGVDMRVPDQVVIYGASGHQWIDTPKSLKDNGIDITQGFEWPCYGFDYLFSIKKYFGISYPLVDKNITKFSTSIESLSNNGVGININE